MLKRLFVVVTPESSIWNEISITALRVFTGLALAFSHGWGKIPPSDNFIGGVESLGFPLPFAFAWAASLAEFAGGLMLAVGLLTRPAAFMVAFTMFVAGVMKHAADPFGRKELALLYLAVAVIFVFRGASRLSVDRYLR